MFKQLISLVLATLLSIGSVSHALPAPKDAFPSQQYDTSYSGPPLPYAIPNHGKVAYAQAGQAVAIAVPAPQDGSFTGDAGGAAVVYP
jgi:hypothetical protein